MTQTITSEILYCSVILCVRQCLLLFRRHNLVQIYYTLCIVTTCSGHTTVRAGITHSPQKVRPQEYKNAHLIPIGQTQPEHQHKITENSDTNKITRPAATLGSVSRHGSANHGGREQRREKHKYIFRHSAQLNSILIITF
jgi:hypothetical protein